MEMPELSPNSVSVVRSRLQEAAGLVRNSVSLDTKVRETLSALLDEIGRALETPEVPPAEVARLAEDAAHLAESLHRVHDHRFLEGARDRLESFALQAETRAPTAVGLTRRLIDALANLGI